MKALYILDTIEKLELKSIIEILTSAHLDFESATNPAEDNDDLCQTVAEVRERMEYSMRYIEKAEAVLRNIVNFEESDDPVSVLDFEDFELSN